MSLLRIPNLHGRNAATMRRIIAKTAAETGSTEHAIGIMMSVFLEELAYEVAKGKSVVIPGFGQFSSYTWVPKKDGLEPYSRPVFTAAAAFTNTVAERVPPDEERVRQIVEYRRYNRRKKSNQKQRVHTALGGFRMKLKRQRPPQ